MVQLGSWTNVAQEHTIDLWSEVFLGDGVVLQQKTRQNAQIHDGTCVHKQIMGQHVAWCVQTLHCKSMVSVSSKFDE